MNKYNNITVRIKFKNQIHFYKYVKIFNLCAHCFRDVHELTWAKFSSRIVYFPVCTSIVARHKIIRDGLGFTNKWKSISQFSKLCCELEVEPYFTFSSPT